jgi:DNA repair protein SbcC/Rad50
MRLKKITLNNIRSYLFQEIDFPEGSTLLSGDIGTGKTSILLGIEFALFGLQPGQKGSSLLRNGEKEGSVIMEFEVDGHNIKVERTLKKSKTITQTYCAITIDEEKKELSVQEVKNKILDILSYPKEFSKKQNILYKFTVYTPQEEMKQIILQDPEIRINTLRHVFGIDKYKTILENVAILGTKLREEKRAKEIMISGLEQDKSDLAVKENEVENKQYNLSSIEKELFVKTEKRRKTQEEKDMVTERIEEKNKLEQEIEKTKIVINNKRETLFGNLKLIGDLKKQIAELETLQIDESKLVQLERKNETMQKEKEVLNNQNLQLTSEISSLDIRKSENQKLEKKISSMEMCPTCLQNVDSVYRTNVLNKLGADIVEYNKRIEILTQEKKIVLKKIEQINSEVSANDKQIKELTILKIKCHGIEEKKKNLGEVEKTNSLLARDSELLKDHIELLRTSIFELKRYENVFSEKQKELEAAIREERFAEIKVAELKKEIEVFKRHIEESKEKIRKTKEIKERLDYISNLESWISKNFASLISFIEKNVMTKLKAKFSKLFAEWFYMLVSDNFTVKLDDDFTPIVEQQDYEIEYNYLSGGERTAIALAYRLALNQVINSLLSKIKTKDLVILDEPTDGFSDQQLDKMRYVLEQLDIGQLIIVSHEPKIEGFVESVVKFKKEDGISKRVT